MLNSKQIRKFIRELKLKHFDLLLFHSDFSHIPEVVPRMENLIVQKVQKPQVAGISPIDRKLTAYNCCYYIWNENELVHQNWVFYKSRFLRKLGFEKLPLMGDGFTIDKFRGRGIQPFVLSFMLKDLAKQGNTGAFTLVSPRNFSHRSGELKRLDLP